MAPMRRLTMGALTLSAVGAAAAGEIRVPEDHATVQAAIAAAAAGDVVLLAPGHYHEHIRFLGKAIVVRGAGGARRTSLDGAGLDVGSLVTLDGGEGPGSVLEDLTIENGDSNAGAGIAIAGSSPTVRRCVIRNNTAHWTDAGGVVVTGGGAPTFVDCVFADNDALGGKGGGLYVGAACSVTLRRCVFRGNLAFWEDGGGLYVAPGASAIVADCAFVQNETLKGDGAGIAHDGALLELTNCLFAGNAAVAEPDPVRGGALFATGPVALVNCSFAGNTADDGGGAWLADGAAAVVRNAVFWGNDRNEIVGETADVTYSVVRGGWPGAGNVDGDPLFVRPPAPGADGEWGRDDDVPGDLHPTAGSAATDTGDNGAVPAAVRTDLDGADRFIEDLGTRDGGAGTPPIVDAGAYEFAAARCPGDVDGDGAIGFHDALRVLAAWGPCAGCPEDLDDSGDVGTLDLLAVLSDWGPCDD